MSTIKDVIQPLRNTIQTDMLSWLSVNPEGQPLRPATLSPNTPTAAQSPNMIAGAGSIISNVTLKIVFII